VSAPLCAGCDVGSTTGKAVILADAEIVGTSIVPSQIDPELTARAALDAAQAALGGGARPRFACLVGTGYGRTLVPFADHNVSEITCHGVGAHHLDPAVRTLVDIGGQDIKAISLHPDGSVREFAMNDKCAAGTGRFFEAMSRVFQMDLDGFSALSLGAARATPITAQCSVFTETEVISLISKRVPPPEIAAGIQAAVAKRVFSLARRVGVAPRLVVTGGCAKNRGLAAALARVLRIEITPLPVDAQLMGALGAAVIARRKASGQ
jgi:predicted CoA-substrate-specific enzyme activase